ncbi:MAG: hypothetical protein AABX29_05235 [Nanoarchaeota archaeon]
MQPDDVSDLIIAMILVVFLSAVVWALQSPVGKNLAGDGLNREAKITADMYNYNFEENIFLVNYLRTPIAKLTVADYILMCDNDEKFKDLKKETDKILRGYDRDVNIIVTCKNEKKIVSGYSIDDSESRTSLFFNGDKGVEIKIYSKGTLGLSRVSSYSKPFGG